MNEVPHPQADAGSSGGGSFLLGCRDHRRKVGFITEASLGGNRDILIGSYNMLVLLSGRQGWQFGSGNRIMSS